MHVICIRIVLCLVIIVDFWFCIIRQTNKTKQWKALHMYMNAFMCRLVIGLTYLLFVKMAVELRKHDRSRITVNNIHRWNTFISIAHFSLFTIILKIVNKTKTNCNIYVYNCLTNLHSNWTHLKICCLNMIYSPFCIDIYEGEEIYQVLTLINR